MRFIAIYATLHSCEDDKLFQNVNANVFNQAA